MKKAKTVYLIHRPALDYEDSLTPYLVCNTSESARQVRDQVIKHYKKFIKKIGEEPEMFNSNVKDDYSKEWENWFDKKEELLRLSLEKPPFNIRLSWQDIEDDDIEAAVSVMELPLV